MGTELTIEERWEWLRKHHQGKHIIPWDRMALPTHEWFNNQTTIYGTDIPLTIPKNKEDLTNDEIEFIGLIINEREKRKGLH